MSAEIDLLPASWLAAQLGDVVNYGKAEKAQPSGIEPDTWVLELEDVERNTSRVLQRLTFASRQSKSAKNKFEQDDVLYGKLRPYLNKVVHADAAGVCTTEIVPLRPNPAIFGRYLFYWLRHPAFLDYVTEVSHGLDMPRLGTDAGKLAPLVLAPYAEQQRIAEKLDTVLARVEACRDRLANVAPLVKRFRQSILAAATSGRLTEDWRLSSASDLRVAYLSSVEGPNGASPIPETWAWVAMAELSSKIADGVHKKPNYVEVGIPFLTVKNLTAGPGISFATTAFVTEADHAEFCRRTHPERDDILITKDGTLGVVRRIDTDRVFSVFVSLALVKLKDRRLAKYVTYALQSPVMQAQMTGVGTGLQHIHLTDLRKDLCPLPPLDEQVEIVRRVEILLGFAERLEARLALAQATTDRLTPALLAKAFRGELVPQDPADEPAAELLQRLALQQKHAKTKARPRAT